MLIGEKQFHTPQVASVAGLYADHIHGMAEKELHKLPGNQGDLFAVNPVLTSSLISTITTQLYDKLYQNTDQHFSKQAFINQAMHQAFAGKDVPVKTAYGMLNLNKRLSEALLLGFDTSQITPLYADPPRVNLTNQRKNFKTRLQQIETSFTQDRQQNIHFISATQAEQNQLLHYADAFLAARNITKSDSVQCSQQRGRILGAYFYQYDTACHDRTDFIKFVYGLAEHLSIDEETRQALIHQVTNKRTLLFKSSFADPDYQHFTLEELNALEEEINRRYIHCSNDPKGYVHDRYVLLRKIMTEGVSMNSLHKKLFGERITSFSDKKEKNIEPATSKHGMQLTLKEMYRHFPDGAYAAERKKGRIPYNEALRQVLKPHKQSYEKGILIKLFNNYNYYHRRIAPRPKKLQKMALESYRKLLLSKTKPPQLLVQPDLFSVSTRLPSKLIDFLSIRVKFSHP